MKTRTFLATSLAGHARTITTTRQLIFRRACLWTGFLAFAMIALGPQPVQAAVIEAWVHRFSNVLSNTATCTDHAVKVVRDAAGDIIVTGGIAGGYCAGVYRGEDMLTIKYSGADGSVLWQQRYNGESPTALAVDGSGNVVVTGYSVTIKYLADGTGVWTNSGGRALAVDGSGNVVVTGHSRTIKYLADGTGVWTNSGGGALAVDGNGNVVVTGYSYSTTYDYYTAKYAAADGVLLWEKRYTGPANGDDRASALAVDGSGNVVVTAYSVTIKYLADGTGVWTNSGGGALAVDGSGNVVVTGYSGTIKYLADGTGVWTNSGGGALAVDGSGNVVVTGGVGAYYTAKYAAADGVLLWENIGPADSHEPANAVAVDGSGNVVVTGWTDVQAGLGPFGGDYYTAKYAAVDGALLWEQRYNGSVPNDASAQAVAVDGSGNVAVTGVAYNYGFNYGFPNGDYYTAKYAAVNGALLWEKRYNGPANSDDYAKAMALDGSGNVVVTGYSYGTNSGSDYHSDYYTAKYAAADGALLWEKRYNGPANSDDSANAVMVDGSGNVVVTGYSYSTTYDYYTAKYAAADGALLWEKRYNGPANSDDQARALAVDGSGNVVVTGYSVSRVDFSGNTIPDYYTAKYAAADGALLWEKRYNGPANSDDYAIAVAVDGSGNVVVTGTSYNANFSNPDYYTAKYAAADGALLWEKRYNGPANSDDQASAVAVDGSGNVVVTGSSVSGVSFGNTIFDYYTAKYAAATGALLWEQRYNGPANNYDFARAVAVDGSGNVVVTGNSAISGFDASDTIFDYYTAKYSAADGGLLWEKRFTGPASVGDSSHCLALGPDGMVAVTGTSNGGYATVVYREVPSVSIDLISTGVRLRFTGVPGRSYNLERAPAVTGPWSTINTQIAPASGLLEYLETAPHPGPGFFRIVQP